MDARRTDLSESNAKDAISGRETPSRGGASFRRAEVPFKSAQTTCPSRPTRLADGLELESTPTRIGESAPRHPLVGERIGSPAPAPCDAELGYTVEYYKPA